MTPHPDIEKFEHLLSRIGELIDALRRKNRELQKENAALKKRIQQMQSAQEDIFTAISDTERITLKNTIRQMVERIDRHLGRNAAP